MSAAAKLRAEGRKCQTPGHKPESRSGGERHVTGGDEVQVRDID